MKILCIGDIHGRVFHTAVIVNRLLSIEHFDLIIQVGDFGLFTHQDQLDEATRGFSEHDPSELHVITLMNLSHREARYVKQQLPHIRQPIYVIRGNHENQRLIRERYSTQISRIDPAGIFHFLPDGTILNMKGESLGVLGGVAESDDPLCLLDDAAFTALAQHTGKLDVLVTHDSPAGIAIGRNGHMQGSQKITAILKQLQPRFHLFGHYHCTNGPYKIGNTLSTGMATLMQPVRRHSEIDINPGAFAVIDTTRQQVYFLLEDWMNRFTRNMDVHAILELGGQTHT